MASKKEIKEYVKIKLDGIKKKQIQRESISVYADKYIKDEFLRTIFSNGAITEEEWKKSFPISLRSQYESIAPTYIKDMIEEINKGRLNTYNKNKEIELFNSKIDNRYKDFCTEMLLVGNGQLADFAKAFIESLTEVK